MLEFPKVLTRPLDMSEYHPAYQATLSVWCNPGAAFLERYDDAVEKFGNGEPREMYQWVSEAWSQGDEKVTPEDV